MDDPVGGHDSTQDLHAAFDGVAVRSSAQNRMRPVTDWLAGKLGIEPSRVGAVWAGEPKQLSPRLSTPGLVTARPDVTILAVAGIDDRYLSFVRRKVASDAHLRTVVVVVEPAAGARWEATNIITESQDAPALAALVALFPQAKLETVGTDRARSRTGRIPVVLDERIRRLARTAIVSNRATLLVGPPGTGKTTVLRETLVDIAGDPSAYGFESQVDCGPPITPDESWTALQLVGGMTVDGGEIVFRPGVVLDSIRQNRWVFVDEANRADMDRIFGPLLTWLAGDEVQIGRASEAADAATIQLGWSDQPQSHVENAHLLARDGGAGVVRFLAGTDWRLVGTYNAVDAQRVFRFGAALGRRFAQIPIPPLDADDLAGLVAADCERSGLPTETADRIVALYRSHQAADETVSGPAQFLGLTRYVESAARLDDIDPGDDETLDQILAESYLAGLGSSLVRLEEDELDRLGDRVVDSGGLSVEAWAWARSLLPSIRG